MPPPVLPGSVVMPPPGRMAPGKFPPTAGRLEVGKLPPMFGRLLPGKLMLGRLPMVPGRVLTPPGRFPTGLLIPGRMPTFPGRVLAPPGRLMFPGRFVTPVGRLMFPGRFTPGREGFDGLREGELGAPGFGLIPGRMLGLFNPGLPLGRLKLPGAVGREAPNPGILVGRFIPGVGPDGLIPGVAGRGVAGLAGAAGLWFGMEGRWPIDGGVGLPAGLEGLWAGPAGVGRGAGAAGRLKLGALGRGAGAGLA